MHKGEVLLVNDEAEERATIAAALEAHDFIVAIAANGEEALRRVGSFMPDLIVSDVDMPVMDGYELCRRIRSLPRLETVPFIFISTEGKNGIDTLKGLRMGADDFVNRPIVPDEIVLRVDILLRRLRILQRLTITDEITGLHNRRYFDQRLDEEIERLRRYNRPLAVFLVDVDRFKDVNDTWGHMAGDLVLRTIGEALQAGLRRSDLVARFGGDEFAVIMPEHAREPVGQTAERLREGVAARRIRLPGGEDVCVTISIGGVWLAEDNTSPASAIIRAADAELYRAKNNGRNRVELTQAPQS